MPFALLLLSVLGLSTPSHSGDLPRTKLATAFIYQFTNFIEWPAAEGDFVVTILSDSALKGDLTELASRKTIQGRKLVVHAARSLDQVKPSSQIVILGSDREDQLTQVAAKLEGGSSLLITDGEGLGEKGAMINFFLQGDKLRFEINRKAVQNQKFKIGSQLLNLARIID